MLRKLLPKNTDSCSLSSLIHCYDRITPIVSLLMFDAGTHTMQQSRASRSSESVQRPFCSRLCPSDQVRISESPCIYKQRGAEAALQSVSISMQLACSMSGGSIARGFTTSALTRHSAPPGDLGDVQKKLNAEELLGFESDEDQLRRVEMPLIHPKASVTSEHHPCGAEHLEFPFSAKAFYIGKGYKEMIQKLKRSAVEEGWQQEEGPTGAVICLRNSPAPFNEEEFYTGLPCETYILPLDKMDSVVFFNGFGRERELWAHHTGGQLTSRFIEETRVTVIPNLDKHSRLFSDRVVLQQAELNYLRTIAFVLAQTVSLHFYEMQVDKTLRTFKDMNREMQRTGTFKPIATKEELLQMVAHNNLLFTDIISKLGIMERFDIAWKNTNCNDIYEHLRADMEIENRNENLQVKLHLVSENVKYLLELMQNQKSDFLEWIIIILIGAEILVSLFDMFHKLN